MPEMAAQDIYGAGLLYSKYRTRTRRVSGTYTEAQAALRAFIEEAEAGKTKPAKSYTVSEYIDAWSTQRAESGNMPGGR